MVGEEPGEMHGRQNASSEHLEYPDSGSQTLKKEIYLRVTGYIQR